MCVATYLKRGKSIFTYVYISQRIYLHNPVTRSRKHLLATAASILLKLLSWVAMVRCSSGVSILYMDIICEKLAGEKRMSPKNIANNNHTVASNMTRREHFLSASGI